MNDFEVTFGDTISLLATLTPEAEEWVEQNLSEDRQEFAGQVVIETRYLDNILNAIWETGMAWEIVGRTL